MLFLAGVGSGAGYDLARTIASGDAVVIALAAAGCIVVVQALILVVGYKLLRIPMGRLIGILAAIMTQPGLLAFVEQRAGDDRPAAGYAHEMAYDAARGTTVLFGGLASAANAELWDWNGTDWTQRAISGLASVAVSS